MRTFTKFIGCLALVVTVAATGAFLSSAEEPTLGALVESGLLDSNDPDRGSYEIYEYGKLSNGHVAYKLCIAGSGMMPDWDSSTSTSSAPWLRKSVGSLYSSNITALELSSGLTSIGSNAFYNCDELVLTSLPEGITSIGSNAFYGCSKLALTSLPEGLTSIGKYAFAYCRNLALTSLPDGITSIGEYTFSGCSNLALTSLPDGLTSIGDRAFSNCTNLALTSLPSGLTSIEENAFRSCSNLALTSLPDGIKHIGKYAFSGCSNLALTSLPDGLTSIMPYAFSGCSNLALTSLPDGITSIGEDAFYSCDNLALTSLPSGLTSIMERAFRDCDNLALTSLPSGLTSIKEDAFWSCDNLALTSLPDGITSIGEDAFYSCDNLALISLPEGLTSIGGGAFRDCSNLALTSLPDGLTSIGNFTFGDCSNLALTSLPDGLTSIGKYAFYECANLALTSLPDGLTSIGEYAFYGCNGMELTTLPNATVSVGKDAFRGVHWLVPENHYLQNTDGSYPAAPSEVTAQLVKTTWSTTHTTKTFPGFTLDETALPALVSAPYWGVPYGNTTIKLDYYYTRNAYGVTWKNTDGRVLRTDENVFYGAQLTPPELTAPAGYTFTGWSPTVPDTMPDKALEFTAGFTPNYYSVTVTAADGGTASADCGNEAATDSTVSVSATADNVHAFISWKVLSGDVTLADPTAPSTTFVMPPEEVSIRAEFKGQIGVDTDGDGIPDTKIDANDKGEGKDTAADDGIYTDDNGKKYEEQPKGSGIFVEVTDDYISVDTDGDGKADTEVKANDRGEGNDLVSGDGIYTDESGRKFIESTSGSGVFIEVTGDYIQVDTNKDGIPDIEVKANDKGEGNDKKAGDGKYTADDKTEYVEKPAGSGVYEKKKDDPALNYTPEPTVEYVYIQVDTNLDGVADISVMVNDAGLDNDVAKGDGVYTSPSGVEYVAHPTVAGLYIVKGSFVVDPNEGKIGVDTDGDGKPDTWVDAKDDGIAPDLVFDDKLFTDEDGKLYIEVADKLYKEVTSEYIKVDTDGDGKADIMVKANDNGIDGDITINDGIYTASDGVIYHDPDGDGVFTQASQSDFDAAQKYPADITSDEWYSEAVVEVVENGIIETYEDRTFKANYELTRCAAVYAFAVLNNAELSSRTEILRVYNDVDVTTQYATAIEWAAEMNLVLGYGDGSFGPEDPITREQLIAILHRQYSDVINEPSADIDAFNDADEVSEWALEYMRWAVGNGIVHGDGLGNLNPLQNVTRAEAATIITRVTARDGIGN